MKSMKKIIVPLLLAALTFSISGCNKDNNKTTDKDDETQTPSGNSNGNNNNNNTGNGVNGGNGENTNPGNNTNPGGNTTPGGNQSGDNNSGDNTGTDDPGNNTGTDNQGTDTPGTDTPGTDTPGTDNSGNEQGNNTNVNTDEDDTDAENQEIDANPVPIEIPEPIPYQTVTEQIGPTGGAIQDADANLSITIPNGALTNDASISATYVEEPSLLGNTPQMNFLGAVDFGPSGTVFDEDVEVTIKLTKKTYRDKLSVFCYNEANEMWEYVTDASVSEMTKATFNVRHFSKYQCLEITPDMLYKFVDLVHEAQASGYDDSWILSSYEDYLINDKHVMDEYAIFDGLYYEAQSLFIGGNYKLENGKEGNPNDLTDQIGESNRVGNKLGLATVGGLIVTKEEADAARESNTENQEIIDVMVDIDYVMIKPNIDLSAEKVILEKGESTAISVYTHYTNPTNRLHPELVLPNYPLTLPYNLKHFSTDVKELTTDQNGQGSFVATALSEGTENVKVMFYVSGYFGQYSASYIKLKCGGDYTITGHVSETISGTFKGGPEYETGGMTCTQIGSFNFIVEYGFVGSIDLKEDGTYKGLLQINTAVVSFGGTDAIHYYSGDGSSAELFFTMFYEEIITTPTFREIGFTANVNEIDKSCTLAAGEICPIVESWVDGNVYEIISSSGHSMDFDTPLITLLEFRNSSGLLLPFTLEAGTYTDSLSSLMDTYKMGARTGLGENDWEYADGLYYQILTLNGSTEQEITVVDNRQQANPE